VKLDIENELYLEIVMTKTVAKYTESHDRLTLNVKFANDEHIRLNISRSRASVSSKKMLNASSFGVIAKFMMKELENESPVAHMARIKAFVEQYDSVESAIASI
jgi:hypothetical protein